jgi:transposase
VLPISPTGHIPLAPHVQRRVRAASFPDARRALGNIWRRDGSPPQGQTWRLPPVVTALQARRSVQLTVAATPGAARGALTRIDTPRPLMKFLGLSPSASSRGERRRQSSLTKAGTTHAHRALVEGAWASRYSANVSRHLPRRREQHPTALQDLRWKAQGRWCTRDRRRMARGKHPTQVVVAMARELASLIGAIAIQVPVTA